MNEILGSGVGFVVYIVSFLIGTGVAFKRADRYPELLAPIPFYRTVFGIAIPLMAVLLALFAWLV